MKVVIDDVEYAPIPDSPKDNSLLAALEIRFDSDAGDNLTIRDYLYRLLFTLWNKGEKFSGKRPFGDSGWVYEIFQPLIKHGFIDGELDEDGYVFNITDEEAADDFVFDLIKAIFYGVKND